MPSTRLYTNTSKFTGVAGLVVTTVLLNYAALHSTEIVDNTVLLAKKAVRKAEQILHGGKQKYSVLNRDFDGKLYDTGKTVWK
jgi:hypothetical protein